MDRAGRTMRGLIEDDAVDTDVDRVDKGDELVEAAGDKGAAAIANADEGDEEERVGEAVEVVITAGVTPPVAQTCGVVSHRRRRGGADQIWRRQDGAGEAKTVRPPAI
jgi:hypothetical protein